MSNIRFTMKDLDGTVMPYTSFVISTSTSTNAASFTTNLNGQATVSLSAVSTPYYISKQDGTTESVIAYKFFVPDTTYTLDAELLFVDMGKISKDKNDKSIAALIEAKVVAVNAANRALQVVSLLGDVSTIRDNLANLVQVASNLTNINTVAGNTTNINTVATILGSGNISGSGGASTATDVSFTPSGGLSSTNVQAAIVELDSEKQSTLVSGTNVKTINNLSILGSGNINISGGAATATDVTFTPTGNILATNVQTALVELDSEKQPTLVSGTNIKTINNASILGSGNINISGGAATATDVTFTPSGGLSSTNVQTALVELDSEKQVTLVSGTNIKTINGSSILGSGNIAISGGASDASSVSLAPVGNIASTSVQAAIAELDSEKQTTLVSGTNIKTINSSSLLGTGNVALQVPLVSGTTIKTINTNSLLGSGNVSVQPTLVSGTNIKTINGTSLLGSGDISIGGSVVSKIKIAVIGDSGTAQSVFTQEAWPSFLEKNLIAGGMDVEVYNFAIVGERYFTANGAQYESGATQLQKAVAINPDIIVVALGINDALSERSLVEVKADALTAYNTLRTGAPAAKIIYASQIYWDITHKPLATSLLNREVVPFLFQLRTSGFLSGSYCSSILTDAASTTGHAIIAKWKELDTYIKSLPTIDESFNLDGYKVARLGLLGEDFIHPSQDGSKFLAGQVLKAFLNLSSLSTLTASLRTPIYPNWDDPDTMFALFCESNGSEWVTKESTLASRHISSITSLTRAYRPNNWYMPTRGSVYIGNSNIGSTLPAVAMVEGVKPNTVVEASVNGGAWATTPYKTSSHGTAITVDVASNLFIGTNDYYYRIFNEVYGPYTITTTNPTPLTKSNVGLNNVDNTSDANKPVSTATQNALNAKQTTLVSGSNLKTINNTSLLGAGDIAFPAAPANTVWAQLGALTTTIGNTGWTTLATITLGGSGNLIFTWGVGGTSGGACNFATFATLSNGYSAFGSGCYLSASGKYGMSSGCGIVNGVTAGMTVTIYGGSDGAPFQPTQLINGSYWTALVTRV